MHLSDDSEASDDKSNESDSDSRVSDFDDTEWVDVKENNDNHSQTNLQYKELRRPNHTPHPQMLDP
jgi:hypothetical protein